MMIMMIMMMIMVILHIFMICDFSIGFNMFKTPFTKVIGRICQGRPPKKLHRMELAELYGAEWLTGG